MDFAVSAARAPLVGAVAVPASKSLLQRLLALNCLADEPLTLELPPGPPPGDDVRRLTAATARLGRWQGAPGAGWLGGERASLTLDLGLGATGFRLALALAALRPPGARTLVRGRPALLARPHRMLARALERLGVALKRRSSGAYRVHGGLGTTPAPRALRVPCRTSSQHLTALLLIAPRIGGLRLTLLDRPVSRPYLALTLALLRDQGVAVEAGALDRPGGRLEVAAGAPRGGRVRVEPDASAAAYVWAAAALTGGSAWVPGLAATSAQADAALLPLLARMGARVEAADDGSARVTGPGGGLRAAGDVDLTDAPDLLPLAGALAAAAEGTTRLVGVAHARVKESDRVATTARALVALGGRVTEHDDGLTIEGGGLRGGPVDAAGDHRLALAFGVLGLVLPGTVVRGAEAVAKSQPGFLAQLVERTGGAPPAGGGVPTRP